MVKKSCELCSAPARIYCEADRAILCWDCDNAVHAANFLVARHSRNLLCQSCNSITEWRASGSELGRLISVCQRCDIGVEIGAKGEDYEEIDVRDNDDFGDTEDEADGLEEEEVVSDDENRDNRVVPWSVASPPWTSSSSSSEESTPESAILLSSKRKRGDSNDLSSPAPPQEDLCDNISSNYGYASTMAEDWSSGEDGAETEGQRTSVDSFRPVEKNNMKSGGDSSIQPQSVAASFRRLVRRDVVELGKGNGKGDVGSPGSLSAVGFKMK